ncbi:MAG: sulfite exporter TauE/SafE family protein [Candidatus Xenobia bacterium]
MLLFLLGLVGSLHCLAMCSAFVICTGPQRQPWYQAGRLGAYSLLGALLSLVGVGVRAEWDAAGGVWALRVAGGLMILMGVLAFSAPSPAGGWLRPYLAWFLRRPSRRSAFALGGLTGALPCGLLYAAFTRAAVAGSPLEGALLMASFWAGTLPALLGVGMVSPRMPRWVMPAAVVVLGVITLAHGFQAPAVACPYCR